jgi:L-malate glycosyltransferase
VIPGAIVITGSGSSRPLVSRSPAMAGHDVKHNILHLIGSFHQGGSERQGLQLVRLLRDAARYRVHVACLNRAGALLEDAEHLQLGDIPEFRLTSFYNRNAAVQLGRFTRFLRERDIALVQTHDFYTNVFGMAAAALARVPVRIAARRETTGYRTAMQKRVERLAYRLAHAVVANSNAVKRELIAQGVPEGKVVTIYNGLDPVRVTPPRDLRRDETLAALSLPSDDGRRFVTILANLRHADKDHPTFLRAARRVKEKVSDAAFIVAGEGQLVDPMRALALELGLGGEAFFIGGCRKVAELLAVSEVCVLSSKGVEGFANAILEYMAAGRPVVATDVGGAREAVRDGETGYLVSVGDASAMADRIIALLSDPERARAMGERGRQVVAKHFSCEIQLQRTHDVYDRLLWRRSRQWSRPAPSPAA